MEFNPEDFLKSAKNLQQSLQDQQAQLSNKISELQALNMLKGVIEVERTENKVVAIHFSSSDEADQFVKLLSK